MPSPDEVIHLLRRAEFFAPPGRVAELSSLATRGEAVANVLDVEPNPAPLDPNPVPPVYDPPEHAQRIRAVTLAWVDAMVNGANPAKPRRLQDKMALFWHG